MPKKKRTLSDEQKAKMAEGRRKAREAKLAEESIPTTPASEASLDEDRHVDPVPVGSAMPVPDGVVIPRKPVEEPEQPKEEVPDLNPAPAEFSPNVLDMFARMQNQIADLQAQVVGGPKEKVDEMARMQGAHVGHSGVQGRVYIYPIEPAHYPNPVERLYAEPKLRRFALKENFYIKWEVTGETYEKYGVTYTEPRFIVELWRYMFDEETGEPTGEMFLVGRHMQHEDELIARLSADKLGLKLGEGEDFETLQELMDEMRYFRIKRWLLETFTPFRAQQHRNRKMKQKVVGGRVVEVTDTEVLIDAHGGVEAAESMERDIQLTPAERKEAERAGLL